MDRETFNECLAPAVKYYAKILDGEVMQIYFEELGGLTEKKLSGAVRDHISSGHFFPKVADIRKYLREQVENKERKRVQDNPEWGKTHGVAERELDARIKGVPFHTDETTAFPISPLVDQAYECYQKTESVYQSESAIEHSKRSYAFGLLNVLLCNSFA